MFSVSYPSVSRGLGVGRVTGTHRKRSMESYSPFTLEVQSKSGILIALSKMIKLVNVSKGLCQPPGGLEIRPEVEAIEMGSTPSIHALVCCHQSPILTKTLVIHSNYVWVIDLNEQRRRTVIQTTMTSFCVCSTCQVLHSLIAVASTATFCANHPSGPRTQMKQDNTFSRFATIPDSDRQTSFVSTAHAMHRIVLTRITKKCG